MAFKSAFIVSKKSGFSKNVKKAPKKRLFDFGAIWTSKMEKRLIFDLGLTGFVLKALFGF